MDQAKSENMDSPVNIKSALHEQFYLWARNLVRNKIVLDAGCGNGQGTRILAETAHVVTGVDNNSSEIALAEQNHQCENLDFRIMDCTSLDYPSGSFDLVVCNALLEYLPDPIRFFQEARRVLNDDGQIVCGTKNLARSLTAKDGEPLYRNHLQEYSAESLVQIMSKQFKNISVLGEKMYPKAEAQIMNSQARGMERILVALNVKHMIPGAIRRGVRRLITGVDIAQLGPKDFYVTDQSIDDALYVICVGDVIA